MDHVFVAASELKRHIQIQACLHTLNEPVVEAQLVCYRVGDLQGQRADCSLV
jgi:hypothetical protein